MRRGSLGLPGAFVALAASTTSCSDSLPSELARPPEIVHFVLSDAAVAAFGNALEDVRGRILPGISDSESLAGLIGEVTAAIEMRDQLALRQALQRTESALARLGAADDNSAIAPDLDVVRLILDQARPLAGDARQ